jgi:hypothetical protein
MTGDIVFQAAAPELVVVGFFTPDYRAMAEGLAASIDKNANPVRTSYHLYAVPKPEGTEWHDIILMKPQIVLRAMAEYPNSPIVLMDVDCRISGNIDGLADVKSGDVGVRYTGKMHSSNNSVDWFTSRVMVVRQTEMARLLMVNWLRLCQCAAVKNDETLLSVAIRVTPLARLEIIPFEFSAVEEHKIGGRVPVISHVSAHSASRPGHSIKMFFRNGRRGLISRIVGRPYRDLKNSLNTR